jgi:hypothetical protein
MAAGVEEVRMYCTECQRGRRLSTCDTTEEHQGNCISILILLY